MKKNILLLMALLSASAVYSQKDTTLSRTVIVENNYNPEIMDASKVNILPKVDELKAPKTNIEYITAASPYTGFKNSPMELQIVDPLASKSQRGYVRAGFGNYANTDLFAKYMFLTKPDDRLSVDAGLNGMKGKLKDWNGKDWNSRFFTSHVNVGYAHYFKGYVFTVGGKYKSQVFNYDILEGPNSQHNTMADVNASIKSTTDKHPLSFYVRAGYRNFDQKYAINNNKAGSQGNFYANGDVWGKLTDDSHVGIAFELDNLSYSSDSIKGYTSFRGNPYYEIESDDWKVRIGAHADYNSGIDKGVEFAPDLMAQYTFSDHYQIYAKLDGGQILNDFYHVSSLSPYSFLNMNFAPTSIPLDAKLGFKASPMNEMWFHLFGGYRIAKNDLAYALFTTGQTGFYQGKSNCMYVGGEFRYSMKDMFHLNVKAVVYDWSTKYADQDAFLAAKPEITFDINAKYKVIPGLYLNAGFNYEKRNDSNKGLGTDYRFTYKDVKNLYVGAEYEIMNNISIYAKVNNILNSENFMADCYPTEKFNFIGGLTFKF